MTVMSKIKERINQIEEGQLFTYDDVELLNKDSYALSKALSRLVNDGIIERLRKGVFYKPRKTKFGKLQPTEKQILELILSNKTSSNGYITGLIVYNNFGLTTQIPNEVEIATPNPKKAEKIGILKVRYVKGIAPKLESDIEKLQILDALKNFKRIPDRNDELFVKLLKRKISNLSDEDLSRLIDLSKKYSPGTRALLGAILELMEYDKLSAKLKVTLNKLTKYRLGISGEALPNKQNWSII
ncbi:MAG: hypothetical protein DHS20C18_51470 [Saprospiraceae bacterium]|nr:MAG: hypothetical protein DHS20C18_51470 [Saprospiraceae bacterium]